MAVQYTPIGDNIMMQQPLRETTGLVTWWDRLVDAARIRFGPDIQLHDTVATQKRLASFIEDLLFTVVHNDPEPLMARPTIIDVTFKEFINLGERENDETIIRVGKNLPVASGTKYHFSMSEGVSFDHKYNFGPQIVGLCMTGGYMSVGKNYTIKDQSYNEALMFNYYQEEKVIIPPKTKVKAKIVTSTRKYRQNYTLEFSAPRSRFVLVSYYTGAQQEFQDCYNGCCGLCQPNVGYLYAADIMRTLPNFKDSDGYCSFTQDGILTWIGEACSVEKSEQPVTD